MNDNNNEAWTPPDKGCIPAHIRKWAPPQCPVKAVIPLIEVATPENLKGLSNCFVYVQSTNTTYYIDNQHRFIVCWSGPVESNNYDLDANVLGLRNQFLIDEANECGAYYDKVGGYSKFTFDGGGSNVMRFSVSYANEEYPTDWTVSDVENSLVIAPFGYRHLANFTIPDVNFTNESTQELAGPDDIFELLESGKRVILDHVPLGAYFPYDEPNDTIVSRTFVDGIELSHKETENISEHPEPMRVYTGGAFVSSVDAYAGGNYLGVAVHKDQYDNYWFTVQGFGYFHSNN